MEGSLHPWNLHPGPSRSVAMRTTRVTCLLLWFNCGVTTIIYLFDWNLTTCSSEHWPFTFSLAAVSMYAIKYLFKGKEVAHVSFSFFDI
jgi:hypothetical protein